MTTYNQEREFKSKVVMDNVLDSILQDAIDWIQKNMNPDDVFTDDDLTSWATSKEIDSVFPAKELEAWAESNGYSKETE